MTYGANEPIYSLTANVGPVLNSERPLSVTIFLRNGASLTDALRVEGPWLWNGNVTNYYASFLLIQPKFIRSDSNE